MGHPYNSWWTGSILSIEEAKSLAPGQNATTVQVGLGVVTAVMWMIEQPEERFLPPGRSPPRVRPGHCTAIPRGILFRSFRLDPVEKQEGLLQGERGESL